MRNKKQALVNEPKVEVPQEDVREEDINEGSPEPETPVEEKPEESVPEETPERPQEEEPKEEGQSKETKDAYVPQNKWTVDIREEFKDGVTEKDLDKLFEEYRSRDLDIDHLYCNSEQAKKIASFKKYSQVKLSVA
jgi:uncharacterized sporulation protein YeaH/YhbH (DUF444 family)